MDKSWTTSRETNKTKQKPTKTDPLTEAGDGREDEEGDGKGGGAEY